MTMAKRRCRLLSYDTLGMICDLVGGDKAAGQWRDYRLSPAEARVMTALFVADKKGIRWQAMEEVIYMDRHVDRWPLTIQKCVHVLIHKLRRKLEESGAPFEVENVFGTGYVLRRTDLKPNRTNPDAEFHARH